MNPNAINNASVLYSCSPQIVATKQRPLFLRYTPNLPSYQAVVGPFHLHGMPESDMRCFLDVTGVREDRLNQIDVAYIQPIEEPREISGVCAEDRIMATQILRLCRNRLVLIEGYKAARSAGILNETDRLPYKRWHPQRDTRDIRQVVAFRASHNLVAVIPELRHMRELEPDQIALVRRTASLVGDAIEEWFS